MEQKEENASLNSPADIYKQFMQPKSQKSILKQSDRVSDQSGEPSGAGKTPAYLSAHVCIELLILSFFAIMVVFKFIPIFQVFISCKHMNIIDGIFLNLKKNILPWILLLKLMNVQDCLVEDGY